jgi:HSP20 family protein
MAQVDVQKIKESRVESSHFAEKLEGLAERIRDRAYEIFQHRNRDGDAVDDWLQAESDLIFAPESELIEKDGKYEIRVAAPGFTPAETKVTVFPDAITVSAESTHEHGKNDGDVHFCEFGRKALYRRINLPGTINEDKVTAKLEDGILRITAQKAENLALVKTVHASAA